MFKKYISRNPGATRKIGRDLAKKILRRKKKFPAAVLALSGDLGSGKTTFLQGLARGLGIRDKITSPTFVIMKHFKSFYHFDCYRLKSEKDILALGFDKIVENPQNIVAVEWPEKIKKAMPKSTVEIKFIFISGKKREILIDKKLWYNKLWQKG